jgi:hypothetical protein
MAGKIVPEASITVSLLGKNLDAAGIIAESKIAIDSFVNNIKQLQDSDITTMNFPDQSLP